MFNLSGKHQRLKKLGPRSALTFESWFKLFATTKLAASSQIVDLTENTVSSFVLTGIYY